MDKTSEKTQGDFSQDQREGSMSRLSGTSVVLSATLAITGTVSVAFPGVGSVTDRIAAIHEAVERGAIQLESITPSREAILNGRNQGWEKVEKPKPGN